MEIRDNSNEYSPYFAKPATPVKYSKEPETNYEKVEFKKPIFDFSMIGARLNRLNENTVINKVTTETYSIQAQRDRSPPQRVNKDCSAHFNLKNISLSSIENSSVSFNDAKNNEMNKFNIMSSRHYSVDTIQPENQFES